jgi:hypothetical protein
MPNRLIKDSIHESEKVNALSDFQFRIWVNLITYVDDYGRGDARPAIIKGRCFPLRDEIKADDISGALQQLAASGCIRLYSVDGMKYLYFPNWDDHQRIRTKVSKFPSPDNPEAVVDNSPQTAADCSDSPQNVPLNPNPNPNPNPNMNPKEEEEERAREDDSEWTLYMRDYGNNIGLFPTQTELREDMIMFFDEYGAEALHEFIVYTARAYPDNPKVFFDRLCRNHLGKGIKTAEQAQAAIKDFERKKGGRNGANRSGAGQGAGEYKPIFDGETVV